MLTLELRVEIAVLLRQGMSIRAIARPPLAFMKCRTVSPLARLSCCRLGQRIINSQNSGMSRCENHARGWG